jgi:hypothetical protein
VATCQNIEHRQAYKPAKTKDATPQKENQLKPTNDAFKAQIVFQSALALQSRDACTMQLFQDLCEGDAALIEALVRSRFRIIQEMTQRQTGTYSL